MYVLMKETYSGPLGIFAKDILYDLDAKIVKKLPKGSYRNCPAPQDAQKKKTKKKGEAADPAKKEAKSCPNKIAKKTQGKKPPKSKSKKR